MADAVRGEPAGSGAHLPHGDGVRLTEMEKEFQRAAAALQRAAGGGVAREQARKDLPLCTYTEAYWKVDLHNLLHFLALRMDSHAQWEIRQFATTMGRRSCALFPVVWEAFVDYRRDASHLSRLEMGVIQRLTADAAGKGAAPPYSQEMFLAAQDVSWKELTRSRERDECRAKLVRMGLVQEP